MTIATMDQLLQGCAAGYRMTFFKRTLSGTYSNPQTGFISYWTCAGKPAAGATPPTGVGEVPTNATVGAMPFVNPTGGASSYLAQFAGFIGVNGGPIYLFDRLVHTSGLSGTTTGAQTVNSVSVNRPDTTGQGAMLFLENYVSIGTGGPSATASYTNQAGVSGRTTVSTGVASVYVGSAGVMVALPLQAGDTGVRSVQSVTLSASTGTAGNFGVTIARPVAMISPVTYSTSRDAISMGMPQLYNNACLFAVTFGAFNEMQGMIGVAQL